jgi:hypothetical protein
MKAIELTETGSSEVRYLREIPPPKPQQDEVLIRIAVIGVNTIDLYVRGAGTVLHLLIAGIRATHPSVTWFFKTLRIGATSIVTSLWRLQLSTRFRSDLRQVL